MDIKDKLLEVLSHSEILSLTADNEVYFLHAEGANPPYIEYQPIDERGAFYSEGREEEATYIVQVDIFSHGSYSDLENVVKAKMIEAGFVRIGGADLYEEDTRLFHKAIRFSIEG